MGRKVLWQTYEHWKSYGIVNGYYNKTKVSIRKSRKKKERSWYFKGLDRNWLKSFSFKKDSRFLPWDNEKQWIEYGIKHNFNERSPVSLEKCDNKKERSWYRKGSEKGWINNFELSKIRCRRSPWQTYEEWRQYGLSLNFDRKNPSNLKRSKNKDERSWYEQGKDKKWSKDFEFERKEIKKGLWKDLAYVLYRAALFIEENNLDDLPSVRILGKNKMSSLAHAISSYQGGFPAFRERLREYMGLPSQHNQLEILLEQYVGGEHE